MKKTTHSTPATHAALSGPTCEAGASPASLAEAFLLTPLQRSKSVKDAKALRLGLGAFFEWGLREPNQAIEWINRLGARGWGGASTPALASTCAGQAYLGIAKSRGWELPMALSSEWTRQFNDEGEWEEVLSPTAEFLPRLLCGAGAGIGTFNSAAAAMLRAFFESMGEDWDSSSRRQADWRTQAKLRDNEPIFKERPQSRALTETSYGMEADEADLAAMADALSSVAMAAELAATLSPVAGCGLAPRL